jgi:hypothetical protein
MSLFPDAIACPELVEWAAHYGKSKSEKLTSLFTDRVKLETMPVHGFVLNLIK